MNPIFYVYRKLYYSNDILNRFSIDYNFEYQESIVVITYLPCDSGNEDCLMSYRGALMELEPNLENESYNDLFIVGDLNADPNKGRFFSELNGFIGNNCLTLYDVAKLEPDSYTYVSSTESCGTS